MDITSLIIGSDRDSINGSPSGSGGWWIGTSPGMYYLLVIRIILLEILACIYRK